MNITKLISFMKPVGIDPDALAFFSATGITDDTQKNAVNTLVKDLKGYGLWSSMAAIYPFVGGTATAHKYNLKTPQDTDAAYRLVFYGDWTHNSLGGKNNITDSNRNVYADTKFLCNSLNPLNCSIGIYVGEDTGTTGPGLTSVGYAYQIGCLKNENAENGLGIGIQKNSNRYVDFITNSSGNGLIIVSNPEAWKGFFNAVSRSTTSREYYIGATTITTDTNNVTPVFNAYPIYLGGLYNGSSLDIAFTSLTLFSFAYIATSGFSDAQIADLNTAVQAFQTTLGRAV